MAPMATTRPLLRRLAGQALEGASRFTANAAARIRNEAPARPDMHETEGEQGDWSPAFGRGGKRSNPKNETALKLRSRADWMRTCSSMRKDPKLNQAITLHTTRMTSAAMVAEVPKGAGEGQREIAAFLEEAMGWEGRSGKMCRSWRSILREAVQGFYTGCSIGEEVYYVDGGHVWLEDIEPRPIARMTGWGRTPSGKVTHATFRRSWGGGEYTIPLADPSKGALYITPSYSGDPEGRDAAMLRACHFWIELKRFAAKQVSRGFDQWGSGVPMARINYGYAQDRNIDSRRIKDAIDKAKASVKAFYAGGRGSALLASDIVNFEKFGGDLDVSAGVAMMNLIDEQITTAAGAGQLVMGISSSHGSRSAAEVHGNMGLAASAALLDQVCDAFRYGPAARLVAFNFGPRAPVPLIEHRGLDADGISAHLGTLPHLVAANLLDVPATREKIRRTFGLRMVEEIRDTAASDPTGYSLPSVGDPGSPGPGRGNVDAAMVRNAITVLRAALAPALQAAAA